MSCPCDWRLSSACPHLRRLAQHSASVARASALSLSRPGAAAGIYPRCLCSRCDQAVARCVQRNHGCWQWHHRFPYLVAAVAVMEDICQGGIAGFALHDDRSVGASLQSLHGWVGRPLEDRPGTKEKERLPRPSLMSDAMRLGRRVGGLPAWSLRADLLHTLMCVPQTRVCFAPCLDRHVVFISSVDRD